MIQVQNLTKHYAGRMALDRVSFEVGRGEIVGLLGPNGAGKSSTMRILSGYLQPTAGSAYVNGHHVHYDNLAVRQSVGYMPEMAPLYTDMRVKEYLLFRGALRGMSGRKLRTQAGEVMEQCGIREVRRRVIGNLSKGYRQRVALADALLHRPPLLILDEPTNGLDPTQIRQVRELLRSLSESHTILLSTHILHEVEKICSRVIMIHQGRVHADDTPENLTSNLRSMATLRLEVKADKNLKDQLSALPGLRRLRTIALPEGWQGYTMRVDATNDLRQRIAEMALQGGWTVRELHRQLPTLEDVFVELAASDARTD